jgi:hypothetical protein
MDNAVECAEFVGVLLAELLYRRGCCTARARQVTKYGAPCLVPTDAAVTAYLRSALSQIVTWCSSGELKRVVLLISDVRGSLRGAERWCIDVAWGSEETIAAGRRPLSAGEGLLSLAAIAPMIPPSTQPRHFEILAYIHDDLPTALGVADISAIAVDDSSLTATPQRPSLPSCESAATNGSIGEHLRSPYDNGTADGAWTTSGPMLVGQQIYKLAATCAVSAGVSVSISLISSKPLQ